MNLCKHQFSFLMTQQPFVYKHLLDILKLESSFKSSIDSLADDEFLSFADAVAPIINLLKNSFCSALFKDKLHVLPRIAKCFSRILSRSVSLKLHKVLFPKLVGNTIECLVELLQQLVHKDCNKKDVKLVIIDESSAILTIYLQLMAIFEVMKRSNVMPEESGLRKSKIELHSSENEFLIEITLRLYSLLLSALFGVSTNGFLIDEFIISDLVNLRIYQTFNGYTASQAIHSLLFFSQYTKIKRIASKALNALYLTLHCFGHEEGGKIAVWRTCFPGLFSTLFVLTQSGYKRCVQLAI